MRSNRPILLPVASTGLTGQYSTGSWPALWIQDGFILLPGALVGLLRGRAQRGPSPPPCNLRKFPSVPPAG